MLATYFMDHCSVSRTMNDTHTPLTVYQRQNHHNMQFLPDSLHRNNHHCKWNTRRPTLAFVLAFVESPCCGAEQLLPVPCDRASYRAGNGRISISFPTNVLRVSDFDSLPTGPLRDDRFRSRYRSDNEFPLEQIYSSPGHHISFFDSSKCSRGWGRRRRLLQRRRRASG